jgi:hypothetical protein
MTPMTELDDLMASRPIFYVKSSNGFSQRGAETGLGSLSQLWRCPTSGGVNLRFYDGEVIVYMYMCRGEWT